MPRPNSYHYDPPVKGLGILFRKGHGALQIIRDSTAAPRPSSFKYKSIEGALEAADDPARGPGKLSESKNVATCDALKNPYSQIASILDNKPLASTLTPCHDRTQDLGLCFSSRNRYETETSWLDLDDASVLDYCDQAEKVHEAQSEPYQDDDILPIEQAKPQHKTAKPHMMTNNAPKGSMCLPRQGDTSIKVMRKKRTKCPDGPG